MENYIDRIITKNAKYALKRGKSILLLGARQTGKTTFVEHSLDPDFSYSFAKASVRQRYEADPVLLERELEQRSQSVDGMPLIFIDEIQKIPRVMDIVQDLIDHKVAQFILSGSSARKLKHGRDLNLLPGRVVSLLMTPLLYRETKGIDISIEDILLYGTLPNVIMMPNKVDRETDLYNYVTTYLEEEIRAEAAVRNIGNFSRFLEVAAGDAGRIVNFSKLAQDVGVSDTTIASYYQLLEDCLIVYRIDPIIKSRTKRRLIKSPKYLFFDLGVRRACANEGLRLPQKYLSELFEHYVGNELLSLAHLTSPTIKLRYWRDSAGPEVDYVIEKGSEYIPIEVKWTDKPKQSDLRHIYKFCNEYDVKNAYVVCRTPYRYKIDKHVYALPWQEIDELVVDLLS